jgi:uncharacterized membrane protein YgdD (TMEM256/DUF423 family)
MSNRRKFTGSLHFGYGLRLLRLGMSDSSNDATSTASNLRCAAAVLGVTGVGLGAWGSHALPSRLASLSTASLSKESRVLGNWKTAVSYQLLHAVAILSISILSETKLLRNELFAQKQTATGQSDGKGNAVDTSQKPEVLSSSYSHDWYQRAGQYMVVGSVLFSGSIYLLCLDLGPKKIWGPLTPIGGLCLMAGWTILGASTVITEQGWTKPFGPKKGQ